MVSSKMFTFPVTWPLNLIFAVASFRLLDRAIPTRDIWPFRCWKKYQTSLRLSRRRLQVSVTSVVIRFVCFDLSLFSPHFTIIFCNALEASNLTSSGSIRSSFLPTWQARVSFWAPWAQVPQDRGSPLLLKEKHGKTPKVMDSQEIWDGI